MTILNKKFNLQATWRDLRKAGYAFVFPPVAVPQDLIPDFMADIYRKLIQSNVAFNPSVIAIDKPISQFTHVPDHHFLKLLQSDPVQGKERLREGKGLLCNQMFGGMSCRDRTIANIVVQETLIHGGMNNDDYALFHEFLTTCRPDQAFVIAEASILERAAGSIENMIESTGVLDRMAPLDSCSGEIGNRQFRMRLKFMQDMADCLATAYGIPFVQVYFDAFPKRLEHIGGYALSKEFMAQFGGTPTVLIRASRETFDSVATMINFIGHEMRHHADFHVSERFRQGLIDASHPSFEHAALLHFNHQVGVRLPDSTMPKEVQEKYRTIAVTQYLERGAYEFGHKLEKRLDACLPSRMPDRGHELAKMLAHTMS